MICTCDKLKMNIIFFFSFFILRILFIKVFFLMRSALLPSSDMVCSYMSF